MRAPAGASVPGPDGRTHRSLAASSGRSGSSPHSASVLVRSHLPQASTRCEPRSHRSHTWPEVSWSHEHPCAVPANCPDDTGPGCDRLQSPLPLQLSCWADAPDVSAPGGLRIAGHWSGVGDGVGDTDGVGEIDGDALGVGEALGLGLGVGEGETCSLLRKPSWCDHRVSAFDVTRLATPPALALDSTRHSADDVTSQDAVRIFGR